MEGAPLLRSIRLENLLSFGPDGSEFPLQPLNVLIGPNASGKPNLLDALSLLASTPNDIQAAILAGGGIQDWIWKGSKETPVATLEVTVKHPQPQYKPIRYRLSIAEALGRFYLSDEAVENEEPLSQNDVNPYVYYRYQNGNPAINVVDKTLDNRYERRLTRDDVIADQSILSQRKDPVVYPELTYLGRLFGSVAPYRDLRLSRYAPARSAQPADSRQDVLMADRSNLALVLSDLLNRPSTKEEILDRMKRFYPAFRDVTTPVNAGTVRIFFHEDGLYNAVPASRLSNGSMRYLCLLAVLCHPNPSPIVCIEEPELGLHPDAIPDVAELLKGAASRCQLFVTTHSDALIDALSDVPEAVVVCEKVDGSTQLRRLDADSLKPWLEDYSLRELWNRGKIGGNRW